MQERTDIPELAAFLSAPAATVAAVAPRTVMFAAGGTRRDAVLHGLAVDRFSEELARFSIQRFTDTVGRFFKLGVQHVVAITVRSSQLQELGAYRDFIIDGSIRTLGELGLPLYKQLGCRVRFLGHDHFPEFAGLANLLDAETNQASEKTIWWLISESNTHTWERVIAAAQGVSSFAELSERYFGARVPPVELFVSFGKPFVSPENMPLPLFGADAHCYFYQRPGYMLSEEEIRTMIHDYAYQRRTWVADKSGRYAELEAQRELWERGDILGIGRRVGSFWYPRLPEMSGDNDDAA
jgi:hypothetical protein